MKTQIVIISGPTASGKSKFAIDYALQNNGEIINGDRMQMYKHLSILSASPSEHDKDIVPHHLYNFLLPYEEANIKLWLDLVHETIPQIIKRNKLPIVVGGTGLYLHGLINGLIDIPCIKNDNDNDLNNLSTNELANLLTQIDTAAANSIDLQNKHRLIRAIKVMQATGRSIRSYSEYLDYPQYNFLQILISKPFWRLKKIIAYRTSIAAQSDKHDAQNIITEMASFLKNGAKMDWPIWKMIGSNAVKDYLLNNINHDEMLQKIIIDTNHYAKRQMTWLKKNFSHNYHICT